MNLFLRTVKQSRWLKKPNEDWLEDGELKGDTLTDIEVQNGRLSVYKVTNEEDIKRVSVALAATKDNVYKIDYAVFVDSNLKSFGITTSKTKGETPDSTVNMAHHELGNLTVKRLAKLAEIISVGKHKRIQRREVWELLQESAHMGRLEKEKLKPKLKEKLWPQ